MTICASVLHELSHVLMLFFVGEGVEKITFAPQGVSLVRKGNLISYKAEIFVLMAGCLLNFTLFFIFYLIPCSLSLKLFSVVNLGLGLFNLLPIGTLDGGRILKILLKNMFSSQKADVISKIISLCMVLIFILLGIYLALCGKKNASLLYTSIYLTIMLIFRNYD